MQKRQRPHEFAGKSVKIERGLHKGKIFQCQDYWDRLTGMSWVIARGNPACLEYGKRAQDERLPFNNDVLLGRIGHYTVLIHVSELVSEQESLL